MFLPVGGFIVARTVRKLVTPSPQPNTFPSRPTPAPFSTHTQCFCGIASDDPSQLGEASCNYDCAGDASQTCGGQGAISAYENDLFETPPGYLGCWQDSRSNRVMDVVQSDSSMTNDVRRFPLVALKEETF